MRIFKRIILIAVVLLVLLATTVFVLENQQLVTLIMFGWSAPPLPFAVPVVIAFLLGMLIGPVLAWIASLRKAAAVRTRTVRAK
ncbi:LapA family protein [Pseudomonas sp. CDFA 602]|uniref:lipopolysaccharide assembly protein LapA domain-containing protein n=1 Tax=Pseudomonas californiensis TaxID=2829823 RepID=UPI001E378A12|nr:lipopolysaccharide assembly protein LapA domain-containing protein [Pseudomonas californiensis]MCD5996898.1 LapA family protein [Pseudomonas californiensis]MCD6002448.1 LapA family protein [Pseudomonas californiensis]